MSELSKMTIIIAPHPDDEIIGTYEILTKRNNIMIIYDADISQDRRETTLNLKKEIDGIKAQLFLRSVPSKFLTENVQFFAPDPIYENHPKHREWGSMAEKLARTGYDVIFYNTIMNAPYIREVVDPQNKVALLNKVYPDQQTLWKYDHKYYLFEGYNKWFF